MNFEANHPPDIPSDDIITTRDMNIEFACGHVMSIRIAEYLLIKSPFHSLNGIG